MIDATKLVGGARYWIHFQCDNVWRLARYRAAFEDFASEVYDYGIHELTAAIPIPSPDELGVIAEFLANIAQAGEAKDLHGFPVIALPPEIRDQARTLLEKIQ